MDTTKSVLNEEYPYEVYRSDVIAVIPHRRYLLRVTLETVGWEGIITPTITVPRKKGYVEYGGEKHYMLSTCNTSQIPVEEVIVMSESGCIDISYHCKTQDYRKVPFWGSSKVMRPLGMKKEILSPTKNRYHCTNMEFGKFGAYQFTVQWILIPENQK